MGRLTSRLAKWLTGTPKTAGYKQYRSDAFTVTRDLPWFRRDTVNSMLLDPTLRLGLAMRAAPLCSAEFAYKVESPDGDSKWIPGIRADCPLVAKFVHRQLKRLWKYDLHKLLKAQVWGWSACEVTYRFVDGMVEYDRLLHRSSFDTFALVGDGEVKGVRFTHIRDTPGGVVDLTFPKAIWHAFDPENENPHGRMVLRGAHSPWCDKWLNGGALDVRRLFCHKDAYGGVDISYPSGTTTVSGRAIPNRDIVREMSEQIKAGAVTSRPSNRDKNGNEQWTIERATVPANPSHIFDYPKDLDVEMLRGIEIPDDVITSEATGAWQGKQVPMLAFYTGGDIWLAQVIECCLPMLEFLVRCNFGPGKRFEVDTKPLAEQAMERMQKAEQPDATEQDQAADAPGQLTGKVPGGPNGASPNGPNGQERVSPLLRRGREVRQRLSVVDEATDIEKAVGDGIIESDKLAVAARGFPAEHGRRAANWRGAALRLSAATRFEHLPGSPARDTAAIARLFDLDENQTKLLTAVQNA